MQRSDWNGQVTAPKNGRLRSPGWEAPELPPGGRFPVNVTFSEPGAYVLRALATDGGLTDHRDVAVTVR